MEGLLPAGGQDSRSEGRQEVNTVEDEETVTMHLTFRLSTYQDLLAYARVCEVSEADFIDHLIQFQAEEHVRQWLSV